MPSSALARRASSPSVMPCRIGTGSIPTNERERRVEDVALHRAADRVGAVEHHDPLAVAHGGPHHLHRGAEVGVVPRADVLQVHQQDVEPREHRRGGGGVLAVETVDWEAGGAVHGVGDRRARRGGAAEPVLRAEERHELEPAAAQPVHVAHAGRVHPGLVRHQPEPGMRGPGESESDSSTSMPGRTARAGAGAGATAARGPPHAATTPTIATRIICR